MTDPSRTNQELLEELSILKQKIRELEHSESERKRAEEALRESEDRFRMLAENARDIIWTVDMNLRYTYVSPYVKQMLDYTPEEFMALPLNEVLAPSSLELIMQTLAEELEIEKRDDKDLLRSRTVEVEQTGRNGKIVPAEIKMTFMRNAAGQATGILGYSRDITESRRTEKALLSEKNFTEALLESIPGYLYVYDDQGNLVRWNKKHEEMTGYSAEELSHMTLAKWYEGEDAVRVAAAIEEGLTTGYGEVEAHLLIKGGGKLFVHSNGVRLTMDGKTYLAGVGIDITERKRAEEEKRSLEERLQRAEKMEALGQLAGGVAHDLNNVLGILTGHSELLLMEIPEGSRSKGHVEKILQSTEKGAAIIQDLLNLARRGVTVSAVINLNSVVSSFLKTPVFEKMKDYHPHVTFRTECDKNLLNIKGSPVHLEKTLMNLVSNAAESISGKGEVTIRTESRYLDKAIRGYDEVKEGDYTVLTVSDTGMGIPAENREKIFEPFYTKKTMGRSGTGLGLAIVWGTVKDHNGYIDVQTKVGEGTTFTLYFPGTREELIAPQQKVPIEQYMGKGESVLVVDDIADQRDIASRLLTRLGYEVHLVSSGMDAVEYLKGNKADILVLDMIMAPGIDGLETYQRILEINPKQKAILVSGFSETERVRKAQEIGAGAYVKKPYIMEKIGVAIRDELNR
jgi:PAS domain S-box-containing protein